MTKWQIQGLIWLIPVLGISAVLRAEAAADWRKELALLEQQTTRKLLPLLQMLSQERSRQQQAALSFDPHLDAAITLLAKEEALAKTGRMLNPVDETGQTFGFLQAASGAEWNLRGTRNVKRVTVRGGSLRTLSEDGKTEMGMAADQQIAPGAFASRRNEGGWTCYLISPDLENLRCLIASHIWHGRLTRPPGAPPEKPPPPRWSIRQSTGPESAANIDMAGALLATRQKRITEHFQSAEKLLNRHLAMARRPEPELLLAVALTQQSLESLTEKTPPPFVESSEAIVTRMQGRAWTFDNAIRLSALKFDSGQFAIQTSANSSAQILPTTQVWPGLFRGEDATLGRLMIAVSADLHQIMVMPCGSVFEGSRAP